MSAKYDLYLKEHRENVAKSFNWLKENLPMVIQVDDDTSKQIEMNCTKLHDASKNSEDEYGAYDEYFYGDRSFKTVNDYKYAWLKHIHRNPHHWQYWVLINDNEGVEALDMPYQFIIEMICDWWSFSWKSGNLTEVFDWYNDNKTNIKLSDRTRNTVESILYLIKNKLSPDVDEAKDSVKEYIQFNNDVMGDVIKTYNQIKWQTSDVANDKK